MALNQPGILIVGSIQADTLSIIDYFSSASSIYDGTPLTYTAQFDIVQQTSGWPNNETNYDTFNAYNIEVGYKFNLPTGKIYDVVAIDVHSATSASINFRDTNLTNYISSYQEPPENSPGAGDYGIFIPVINGVPSITNLPQYEALFPLQSYWTDNVIAGTVNTIVESGSGGSVTINDNVNNYLITATGTANTLNGESSLRYDGTGLIIGATGSAQALLQISGSSDLLLIKNGSDNGIKVNSEGVLQFLSQSSTPTVIGGGMYYSGSEFFVGID